MGGSPKISGTFLGIPIIRTIVFGGLYWGSSILGKYHINICILFSRAIRSIKGFIKGTIIGVPKGGYSSLDCSSNREV